MRLVSEQGHSVRDNLTAIIETKSKPMVQLSNHHGHHVSDVSLQIATTQSLANRAHTTSHTSMLHIAHKRLLQSRLCNAGV
jgi:hypothetical protein